MFVLVEENHGNLYVTGPFDTREEAEAALLQNLREIVSNWNDDYYSVLDNDDLMMEWRTAPDELFTDTDVYLSVSELTPPS